MNDAPGGGGSGMMVIQPSTCEPPTLLEGPTPRDDLEREIAQIIKEVSGRPHIPMTVCLCGKCSEKDTLSQYQRVG